MHALDWAVVAAYVAWLVWDGVKRTKLENTTESYFLANRSMPWWAVGLSVMATQLSAITLVGTTGQGYNDGLRFVQFYYGLPIAMIILCVTLVPFFYRARVYTAYEYLERRFDLKTRTFTSGLFLVSRAMSCGAIAAAPAVVLSVVLGWSVTMTTLLILVPAVIYTMLGGVQAVTWTDVKTMGLTVFVLIIAMVFLVMGLPSGVGVDDALTIAGGTGRLERIRFRLHADRNLHVLVGHAGRAVSDAVVLRLRSEPGAALSHGEVRRRRADVAVDERVLENSAAGAGAHRRRVHVSLLPVQPAAAAVQPGSRRARPQQRRGSGLRRPGARISVDLRRATAGGARHRRGAARRATCASRRARPTSFRGRTARCESIRARAIGLVRKATNDAAYNDVNYVFPTWITTALPIGIVGLWIAAIITAATDSIAAELNSLSTASVIDFYKRLVNPSASDAHYLLVSRVTTGFWGIFAGFVAVYASSLGSLIEVVNRFGSFFYGSILGVFMLAILTQRTTGTGAFVGLMAGMIAVASVAFGRPDISFLWHNVIGAVVVVVVGLTLSLFTGVQEIRRNFDQKPPDLLISC